MIEIKPYIEHAVLVGLITPNQPEERTKEYLDELAFLADTHGIVSVKRFTQRLNLPITATYVGEGKLDEIDQYIREHHPIDVVIFDDELSPRGRYVISRKRLITKASRTSVSSIALFLSSRSSFSARRPLTRRPRSRWRICNICCLV